MAPEAAVPARFTLLFQYLEWRCLVHKGSDSQGKQIQMDGAGVSSGPDNYSLETMLWMVHAEDLTLYEDKAVIGNAHKVFTGGNTDSVSNFWKYTPLALCSAN